ncbi:hypothetical protein M378DRAFT_732193 [Amanita muscaria Koide BX008]|uniref:F-box domain-containing protein n=1 Tax=Amanita muscaria (strain Koide BX008) TaxID=946122 RepID=A0A0C2X2W9_AMAMK|nr:hypothetical protein M378DRAFT_732193 [Amanita muscaria Koide BX008]
MDSETDDEYEKISDSSSVLDESSRPPQGTEVTALQAPLDATISVTLPSELVEQILLLLDTESVLTCRLVNREFNKIIQSSTLLQYFLACKAAGVIDNPQSPLSCIERLEALKKREDAWRKLKPVFEMTISVKHQTASSISRSTEGVYFLSDENLKDLNYCHLTSFPQDNPRWTKIPGHGPALNWPGILVNFVTALYEHDLIVNLISSDRGNYADTVQRHSLDLVLLKFSTGEYHPLACRPRIHVQRSPEVRPWIVSRIVGDNLALVIHSDDGTFSDKLFIFDWKSGRRLLQHDATENAYLDVVFLSPQLLLVPNSVLSHLEVWHLPPHQIHPKPPIQILSLRLPAVSPKYSIFEFGCYGEPNPFHHSMPHLPPRPFFSSPENSIIMVTLRLWSTSGRPASYNLIMHRRALLDTIQTWTSPSLLEQQEHLPTWLTNEVTMHQIEDPEDGSVQFDAQSKLVSTMRHLKSSPRTRDFPTFATSRTSRTFPASTDSGPSSVSSGLSTNSSTSRCTFLQVPWAKWGPSISRWFQVNETHAEWITRSNGQRCAFSEPNLLDRRKLKVSVADFNPHNFRRNAEIMARLRSGECDNNSSNGNKGKEEEKEEEFEILDHKGVFLEEVYMGLKCVVYRAPDEYDFDLVLMDEQRLLGLKLNGEGWIESVKVLYIG